MKGGGHVEVLSTTWWVWLYSAEHAMIRVDIPSSWPGEADVKVTVGNAERIARVTLMNPTPKRAVKAALKLPRSEWKGGLDDLGLAALKVVKQSFKDRGD